MKKYREVISVMLTLLIVCTSITSCADTSSGMRPRRQITSCPQGLLLICESQQQPLSKGGAEEEIPVYDHCRCEPEL